MQFFKKHPLMTGTLFLTGSGLLSRLIGFFYRIFISRAFGSAEMGLYQLTMPLLAITFSITAAGFQTAVSKLTSEHNDHSTSVLNTALSITLPLSLVIGFLLFLGAEKVSVFYLKEPGCSSILRLIALSIPFSALHSCMGGYLLAIGKPIFPAVGQLLEQLIRVGSVYLIYRYFLLVEKAPTIEIAAAGILIGEIVSFCFSLWAITVSKPSSPSPAPYTDKAAIRKSVYCIAVPLSANRLIINTLQSLEAGAIPAGLIRFGYTRTEALSAFGVLTAMAMPFIFFPTAITGALSAMLVPAISAEKASGQTTALKARIAKTIRLCLLLGFSCGTFFFFFGKMIGSAAFQNEEAGSYISVLGFLCPFLYLNTTLSGILQGLGKISALFYISLFSLLVRLLFVFTAIPVLGIKGFLYGILAAQLLQTFLYLRCICNKKQE